MRRNLINLVLKLFLRFSLCSLFARPATLRVPARRNCAVLERWGRGSRGNKGGEGGSWGKGGGRGRN